MGRALDELSMVMLGSSNDEPLEEVDCFNYLESQVPADGGCERAVVHRMKEGYRAWGDLKSVLSSRGLGIKAKKCI